MVTRFPSPIACNVAEVLLPRFDIKAAQTLKAQSHPEFRTKRTWLTLPSHNGHEVSLKVSQGHCFATGGNIKALENEYCMHRNRLVSRLNHYKGRFEQRNSQLDRERGPLDHYKS